MTHLPFYPFLEILRRTRSHLYRVILLQDPLIGSLLQLHLLGEVDFEQLRFYVEKVGLGNALKKVVRVGFKDQGDMIWNVLNLYLLPILTPLNYFLIYLIQLVAGVLLLYMLILMLIMVNTFEITLYII